MIEKPTYEDLEKRIQELEQAEVILKRKEEKLQESQSRFQLLYEKTPLAYQSLDKDGIVKMEYPDDLKLWNGFFEEKPKLWDK